MRAIMRLSSYSDYSLRVLMHAAVRSPDRITIDDVAVAFGISRNHLVKIVHALGRNGLLSTRRGIGGGFTIGKRPADILLGEVVRLTEGDAKVIRCVDKHNLPCRILPACRLKGILDEAADGFYAVLDRYTLGDLVRQPQALNKLLGAPIKAQPR